MNRDVCEHESCGLAENTGTGTKELWRSCCFRASESCSALAIGKTKERKYSRKDKKNLAHCGERKDRERKDRERDGEKGVVEHITSACMFHECMNALQHVMSAEEGSDAQIFYTKLRKSICGHVLNEAGSEPSITMTDVLSSGAVATPR